MAKLKITLVKGYSKSLDDQQATVRALGLRKIRSTVLQNDNPQIRGMVKKINHLVKVEEVTGEV